MRLRVLFALAVACGATGVADRMPVRFPVVAAAAGAPVVEGRHPALSDALTRIWKGSPSWRRALEALGPTGRRALVLTPDQVVVSDAGTGATMRFDPSELGEVSPVADAAGRVSTVLVVVNVDRLQDVHERLGSLPGEFLADLERVLAHEVYGHAVPYLEAGHVSGRCADPAPAAPAFDACAIRRENTIRAELRLGRRTDAGLGSLSLLRRTSFD